MKGIPGQVQFRKRGFYVGLDLFLAPHGNSTRIVVVVRCTNRLGGGQHCNTRTHTVTL